MSIALIASLVAVVSTSVSGAEASSCTITGTTGNDVLTGTPGDDVICGLGGNDRINGGGGNDRILAGPGRDLVRGGDGDDFIDGGPGPDRLLGGGGDDTIVDPSGMNYIDGQGGNDDLSGGGVADTIHGSGGRDVIHGYAGDDLLVGGDGGDRIIGGAGSDTIEGGDGNDVLRGGNDDDLLDGEGDNDRLNGGPGTDECIDGESLIDCEDGDGPIGGRARWEPASTTVEVAVGQVDGLSAEVVVEERLADPSLAASPELVDWISGVTDPDSDLEPGRYRVGFAVAPPADAEPGDTATGDILLLVDGAPVSSMEVTVVATETEPSLSEPALPSPSRVGEEDGLQYVTDEVVIAVDLDITDPEAVARSAASSVAGELIGAVPAAAVYQIRVAGLSGLDDLAPLLEILEARAGVTSAGLHVFAKTAAVPDDPEWDSWEATPGGNNFHLERIGAPAAWDITTGSDSTGVGIIDAGIDGDHEDLDDNMISVHNPPADFGSGHGTHVAGTACADGNNGTGVTGVAWDCALRGYDASVPGQPRAVSSVGIVDGMARAASDGARAVNMSFAVEGACADYSNPTSSFFIGASSVAAMLRRSMASARADGHNVLWVKSAGNDGCANGDLHPEIRLVEDFPTNYIVVASTNQSDQVSDFSNTGSLIQIAAPGGQRTPREFILSTLPADCLIFGLLCTNYGGEEWLGTSMAAPQVTGAASLLFSEHPDLTAAQAKECLIRGSEDQLVAGQTYGILDIPGALECAAEDPLGLPPVVDIMFALDLTGSMGDELNQMKAEATDIITGLEALAPATDFNFGVVSFEDNAGFFDSRACGSTYDATYGSGGDVPYRLSRPLTGDSASVQAAINGLSLGRGEDGPESYARVISELARSDQESAQGWRSGALRLTVMFGDNVPHDTDLHEGFGEGLEIPAGLPQDTGREPGRDGAVCTGDDVDFHSALDDFEASGNRLLYIDSSAFTGFQQAWSLWTALGGGSIALADTNGVPVGGADLTETVADLIRASGR